MKFEHSRPWALVYAQTMFTTHIPVVTAFVVQYTGLSSASAPVLKAYVCEHVVSKLDLVILGSTGRLHESWNWRKANLHTLCCEPLCQRQGA
jgi:hypothetical protein